MREALRLAVLKVPCAEENVLEYEEIFMCGRPEQQKEAEISTPGLKPMSI